ncbi:MAG: heme ABC exporter ATP-binding protein CcmA [Gemmatimonadota bacterium]
MNNASLAIDLDGVARRFARRWVLRGVTLRVERGEVVGLTGNNGSGKTTLLRIVSTLLRPTRGGGSVFGHDLVKEAAAVRPYIGYLGHAAGLYDDLTAFENLRFSVRMAGLDLGAGVLDEALERVRLDEFRDERTRGFSAGMRRRLGVARLLVRPPRLLLLDEPYASFDVDGITLVNELASSVAEQGGATLIATHDVARGRGVLSRTLRIVEGRLVQRTLDEEEAYLAGRPPAPPVEAEA